MSKNPVFRTEGIEYVPVSKLKEHPKNPNKHTKDQIERLAGIMLQTGVRRPLTVSKRSDFVTVGNGRLQAAKLMGWDTMPVSYQDYDDEDQEYADMVADNAVASWSSLDLSAINAEIENFSPDFDLDMLGLRDFTVDVADKETVSFEVNKDKKESGEKITCPNCEYSFKPE